MDDAVPGTAVPGATAQRHTWMGSRATGYDILPAGAQQMWQDEFYYLDGTVTLHNLQNNADYHLGVSPVTRAAILDDLTTEPGTGHNQLRYGLARDTDAAPVPQYLTRKRLTATADLLAVPSAATSAELPYEAAAPRTRSTCSSNSATVLSRRYGRNACWTRRTWPTQRSESTS
jgi:hypothetical protein